MARFLTPSLSALVIAIVSQAALADDKEAVQPDPTAVLQPAASAEAAEKEDGDAPATTDAPAKADEAAKTDVSAADDGGQTTVDNPKATEPKPAGEKPPMTIPKSTDTSTPSADPAAEKKLEAWQELHRQWLALDQRLRDAERQYYGLMSQDEDPEIKEQQFQIRLAFEELIKNEANPLLKNLRAEVIKAYKAKPNADVQLVRLLVGFMVNHARMQEEADAKEIVELLIENKADAKYVLVDARMSAMRPTSAEILERLQKRYKDAFPAEKTDGDAASTPDSGGEFKSDSDNGSTDNGSTDSLPETKKTADPPSN